VLDFKSLAESYLTRRWQRLISVPASRWMPPVISNRSDNSSQDISIRQIDQVDERFDSFWSTVKDKYPIMVTRDRAFITWRFAGISGRQYCILAAEIRNHLVGYIVLRCSVSRNTQIGLIMDFLVSDDDSGFAAGTRLIAEAEKYFQRQKMTLITGLMPSHTSEYRILRHSGYYKLPNAITPRLFHFAVYVHKLGNNDFTNLPAREWFITCADFESH
jgi:hypothetical protein